MKSLTTAVFAALLTLGAPAAFAQAASGAMGNDAMSHDAMSKGGMSHDSMGKSSMSHDSMKKSNKMKKHDAMGMEHGASGTMNQ
ncbi:pentapeptide MXKDX repeat protein [Paraburkholderia sp. MPAMCS5]|uniref:pentapeptide MXKDX repeat protein n=1 Tax=Paraburkholderia sp. MPAMCS5 TaxID=3112563 RepID=UPI002E17E1AE|nr:pentapeptide MXKDX repeat protein [Paraburkholderia sp. MPAMCS5]